MAGDWIKMRSALTTCPKVAAMARSVGTAEEFRGLSRQTMRLLVVGGLHAVWTAVNEHTSDGVMANSYVEDVDDIAGIDGFGEAMQAAGWLEADEAAGTLTFPNFHQWNTPAKDSTAAERMRKHRQKQRVAQQTVTVTRNGAVTVTPDKTRQDKRETRQETHTRSARVCLPDAHTHAEAAETQDFWEEFRQAWNKTPNTKPYNALGCPSEALGVVTDPSFRSGFLEALARLGASSFFSEPAAMTWFLRNWSRVLAGEFDGRRTAGAARTPAKIFQLEEDTG